MKLFWVVQDKNEWHVRRGEEKQSEACFGTRHDAVAWACRMARLKAPSQVAVRDEAGNVIGQFDFPKLDKNPGKGRVQSVLQPLAAHLQLR